MPADESTFIFFVKEAEELYLQERTLNLANAPIARISQMNYSAYLYPIFPIVNYIFTFKVIILCVIF